MSSTVRPSAAKHTVVEEGSSFKGTLTSSCPIHVHGRVEGELETPALTVSATGAVHGRAKVGAVRSQGELSGEFDAESIELAGTVKDNTIIRARSLEVKLSSTRGKLQVIFGECELAIGEPPSESDRVEPPVVKEEPSTLVAAIVSVIPTAEEPLSPDGEPSPPMASAEPAAAEAVVAAAAGITLEAEAENVDDEDGDEGDEDEGDEGEQAAEPTVVAQAQPRGKRHRRRKQLEQELAKSGWSQPPSHPPSQPPPAS